MPKNIDFCQQLLNRMLERDQLARTGKGAKYFSVEDNLNIDTMAWLIKTFGFPSFERIGFEEPFTSFGLGGVFYMVYWHNRNNPRAAILDSLGMKAVLAGDYPPDEFAEVYDFRNEPRRYGMLVPGIAVEDRTTEKIPINSINKYRAEIYLESLEEYKRKLIYMHSKGRNYMRFLLTPQIIFGMNYAR